MRVRSDREVKEGKQAAATMGDIDARARKQYEEDLKAAQQARADTAGEWVSRCLRPSPSACLVPSRTAMLGHSSCGCTVFALSCLISSASWGIPVLSWPGLCRAGVR